MKTKTRSVGAFRSPISSWCLFGLLDFIYRALWASQAVLPMHLYSVYDASALNDAVLFEQSNSCRRMPS